MGDASTRRRAEYEAVAGELLAEPGVTRGSGKKGFGSSASASGARSSRCCRRRAGSSSNCPGIGSRALVAAGHGERFDPGHGRLMKEWLEVGSGSEESWPWLAREALEFVGR